EDGGVGVEAVAVVEQPAWRLARAVSGAGHGLDRDERRLGLVVRLDQPQRLVTGVDELDAADDDAAERVAARRLEPGLARGLLRQRREPVVPERAACERAAEVRAAVAAVRSTRVQRGRALDLQLLEVLFVLGGRGLEARARGDAAPPRPV